MMFGESKNLKRLRVIGPDTSTSAGKPAADGWLLRYNGQSGSVSIDSIYGDGELGCL